MKYFSRTLFALTLHYVFHEVISKKGEKKRIDPQVAAAGAKGVQLFEAGRFQDALAVFSE